MQRFLRPRLNASMALVAAFGAALLSSPPANATPVANPAAPPTCAYNRVCMWSLPFYEGFRNTMAPADPGNCKNLPITVRSVWNNTAYYQRLHVTWVCTGGFVLVAPHTLVPDLGDGRRGLGSY